MENAHVPILGFAAFSGTGKTTLLSKLIPVLSSKGIRVGLIKHSHHNFEIDKPGKDSYQLRKSGATPLMLVSSHRRAIITEFNKVEEPKLNNELTYLDQTNLDLILVEGFKSEPFPKIEIHRPALNKPLIFTKDPHIIALASDDSIEVTEANSTLSKQQIASIKIPLLLDLNSPDMIADFILNHFMGRN